MHLGNAESVRENAMKIHELGVERDRTGEYKNEGMRDEQGRCDDATAE